MNILKIIVSEDPNVWSKALPIATFALNTSVNRSLKDTPHFFVFAQDPRMPYGDLVSPQKPIYNIDIYKQFLCKTNRRVFKTVRYMLEKASSQYQREYNIRFSTTQSQIKDDDLRCIYLVPSWQEKIFFFKKRS